jgi:ABC-2 type transport system permease protein
MGAVLTIAAKDLRQRLRDRSAILMAVVIPLALAGILSSLFGSADVPRPFRYAVVDLDGGQVATAFSEEFLSVIEADEVIEVRRVDTVAQARRLAADSEVDAAFVLTDGFSAAVGSAAPASIEVIGDVDSPTGSAVAASLARAFVSDLNTVRVSVGAALAAGSQVPVEQLAAAAQRSAHETPPIQLDDVSADAKLLDATTYLAAGMAVFFLFFTVQFGVSSLLDEKAGATLGRLLAAPIPRTSVLVAKLVTSLVLGVASLAVLVVATTVLLGADWGDPLGVALLVVAGVLAATGVTALVASVARTTEQAGNWTAIIAVVLGLLGGAFFQVSQAGSAMAALSLVTPHAWFLRGLGDLAGGGGPVAVLPAVGALFAFAAVTGGLAVWRVRKAVLW